MQNYQIILCICYDTAHDITAFRGGGVTNKFTMDLGDMNWKDKKKKEKKRKGV